MRSSLLLAVALLGCAAPAPSPEPKPPAAVIPPSAPAAPSATSPDAARGPVVVIGPERVTLEGRLMGSVPAIARLGRMQKLDELFTTLKERRDRWKVIHPGEAFPGVATLQPHPQTSGVVLASAYETMAYAGYPNIDVIVSGRPIRTRALIPGPPCGHGATPCPPAPAGDDVHVQGDATSWRLRRFGDEPLDEHGDASASAASLRERLTEVTASRPVSELTFHVSGFAPFATMAPYLEALAQTRDRLRLEAPLTFSVRDIASVAPRPSDDAPVAGDPAPSSSARLPPKVIQSVVRASFGDFRTCYEDALRNDPHARGRVVVRFVIATDGHVSAAAATVEEALPDEVGACLEKAFVKLSFPEPDGGIVTVSYPIVFTPGD